MRTFDIRSGQDCESRQRPQKTSLTWNSWDFSTWITNLVIHYNRTCFVSNGQLGTGRWDKLSHCQYEASNICWADRWYYWTRFWDWESSLAFKTRRTLFQNKHTMTSHIDNEGRWFSDNLIIITWVYVPSQVVDCGNDLCLIQLQITHGFRAKTKWPTGKEERNSRRRRIPLLSSPSSQTRTDLKHFRVEPGRTTLKKVLNCKKISRLMLAFWQQRGELRRLTRRILKIFTFRIWTNTLFSLTLP